MSVRVSTLHSPSPSGRREPTWILGQAERQAAADRTRTFDAGWARHGDDRLGDLRGGPGSAGCRRAAIRRLRLACWFVRARLDGYLKLWRGVVHRFRVIVKSFPQ